MGKVLDLRNCCHTPATRLLCDGFSNRFGNRLSDKLGNRLGNRLGDRLGSNRQNNNRLNHRHIAARQNNRIQNTIHPFYRSCRRTLYEAPEVILIILLMILRHAHLNRQSTPFYTMLRKLFRQKKTYSTCTIFMCKEMSVDETPGRRS